MDEGTNVFLKGFAKHSRESAHLSTVTAIMDSYISRSQLGSNQADEMNPRVEKARCWARKGDGEVPTSQDP